MRMGVRSTIFFGLTFQFVVDIIILGVLTVWFGLAIFGCQKGYEIYDENQLRTEVEPVAARMPGLKGIIKTCWKVKHAGTNSFLSPPGVNETSYELWGYAELSGSEYLYLKDLFELVPVSNNWQPDLFQAVNDGNCADKKWLHAERTPNSFFRDGIVGSIYFSEAKPVIYFVIFGE